MKRFFAVAGITVALFCVIAGAETFQKLRVGFEQRTAAVALTHSGYGTKSFDFAATDEDGGYELSNVGALSSGTAAVGDFCNVAPIDAAGRAAPGPVTCQVTAANVYKLQFTTPGISDVADAGFNIRTYGP